MGVARLPAVITLHGWMGYLMVVPPVCRHPLQVLQDENQGPCPSKTATHTSQALNSATGPWALESRLSGQRLISVGSWASWLEKI
jgi:hypothetical protein